MLWYECSQQIGPNYSSDTALLSVVTEVPTLVVCVSCFIKLKQPANIGEGSFVYSKSQMFGVYLLPDLRLSKITR